MTRPNPFTRVVVRVRDRRVTEVKSGSGRAGAVGSVKAGALGARPTPGTTDYTTDIPLTHAYVQSDGDVEADVARALANEALVTRIASEVQPGAKASWAYAGSTSPARMAGLLSVLRRAGTASVDPFVWFTVTVETPAARKLLARLRKHADVAVAYIAPEVTPSCPPSRIEPAPALPVGEGASQGYRAALNLADAASRAGGKGENMAFADVEPGWVNHDPDLGTLAFTGSPRADKGEWKHGTAVLGVLVAKADGTGCVGLAPSAEKRLVAFGGPDLAGELNNAILAAFEALVGDITDPVALAAARGRVLLVEAQLNWTAKPPDGPAQSIADAPVEVDPLIFGTIRLITDAGIVVVEPVGNNAAIDLDKWTFATERTLDADTPFTKLGESGAILVGGCSSTKNAKGEYSRKATAKGATRVDTYAWAENVYTCGPANDYVLFTGSSSAAAIVAGVALVIQGIRRSTAVGQPMTPSQMRTFLRSGFGTKVIDPEDKQAKLVGTMPDFKKMLASPLFFA